ncbi:MAG: hypothetical protein FD179_1788 [Erysipelotrichaceae bacterium]|nr:MAG: hypothetical protein FD179_1788 [Erysipelotrichaceae bacterium]
MKRFLIIVLVMFLGLCACHKTIIEEPIEHKPFPKFPVVEDIAFAQPHGTVSVADSNPIYTNCQISWTNSTATTESIYGAQVTVEISSIEGLKDQSIQTLINQKIATKAASLRKYSDITTYSNMYGFYATYPVEKSVKHVGIFIQSSTCYNNILSILFIVTVQIKQENYDFLIFDSLNIDLNTGDELTLSDLFVNESDFKTRLNEQILLRAQSHIDVPVGNINDDFVDQYRYIGGFTGIRGDVGFLLTSDMKIVLQFGPSYPEFFNNYGTVKISIDMEDLKDILAFGQRFVHNDVSLFTNPEIQQTYNYLAVTPYDFYIRYERINGIRVRETVTISKNLSDEFKSLQERLFQDIKQKVAEINETAVTSAGLMFSAYPNGIYMNVISMFYSDKIVDIRGTYKSDGSKLTYEDLFVDGFDYRTYLKNQISTIITDSFYTNTYDPEQVLDSLTPSLIVYCSGGECNLSLTNEYYFDASQDEGDFTIRININDHPEFFKILPW